MDSCSHLNWEWSWLACSNRSDKNHFLIEFREHLLAQSIQNILMHNTSLLRIELLVYFQCQQNLSSVHWQPITAYNVNLGHIFVSLSIFIYNRCLFTFFFFFFPNCISLFFKWNKILKSEFPFLLNWYASAFTTKPNSYFGEKNVY